MATLRPSSVPASDNRSATASGAMRNGAIAKILPIAAFSLGFLGSPATAQYGSGYWTVVVTALLNFVTVMFTIGFATTLANQWAQTLSGIGFNPPINAPGTTDVGALSLLYIVRILPSPLGGLLTGSPGSADGNRAQHLRRRSCVLALGAALAVLQPGGASAAERSHDWDARILANDCAGIADPVQRAAASGEPDAVGALAAMYDRGCGVAQDMPHALRLYAERSKAKPADVTAAGYVALYGTAGSSGDAAGIGLLTKAIAAREPFAAFDLAFYLSHRYVSSTDLTQAYHWDLVASQRGDAVASALVGQHYVFGLGVAQNAAEGKQLLAAGVAANVPDALASTGIALMNGYGGYAKHRVRGFALVRKAIDLGLSRAKIALVTNLDKSDYDDGRITVAEAATLSREGSAALEPRAYYDSVEGDLELHRSGATPAYGRIVPLLQKGASLNLPTADEDLAYCYFHGYGVPVDAKLGYKHLRAAAQKGSTAAIAFLKQSGNGSGTENDPNAYAENYEGYNWNRLHPMSTQPLPGSPAAPGGH